METSHFNILGTRIRLGDYDELLSLVLCHPEPVTISYAHFDILLQARKNEKLRALLNSSSTITYIDGIAARLAIRMLFRRSAPKVNATDFNYRLLDAAQQRQWRIACIGGTPGIEYALKRSLLDRGIPEECLFIRHGYYEKDDGSMCADLSSFGADMLFLGMGHPKQFAWVHSHASCRHAPIIVIAGAFLDFIGGMRQRAPRWMRRANLEWLHRLLLEPGRLWRRYLLAIPAFFMYLLMARFKRSAR